MKFKVKQGQEFELTIDNEKDIDTYGKVKFEKYDIKFEFELNNKSTFLKYIDLKTLILLFGMFIAGIYGANTGNYTIFNSLSKSFNKVIEISSKSSANQKESSENQDTS
ncbi:hypothetical protein [Methylobacter sp.]|uniref:hypothetical protein n=1 Tax=Methylobacter sp. TaxID=2051955 RepID=UPI003DA3E09D